MEKYYDLEMNILSCIVQKPELFEKCILEDKHFIKNKKMWLFIKAFYNKFKTIDIMLMYQIIRNKYQYIEYLEWLIEVEPSTSKFDLYQKELIRLYEEKKKEKEIINKIFDLSNKLLVGSLGLKDFKEEINKL